MQRTPKHPTKPEVRTFLTQRVGRTGLVTTLVLIALITLTPQSSTSPHGEVSRALLNFLYKLGVPGSFGPVQWEFTANIIMFLPLGFFFALALTAKQRRSLGPLIPFATLTLTSVFIETTQALFLPSRYPTLSDVIANSLGGWGGYLAGLLAIALFQRLRAWERKGAGRRKSR